MTRSTVLVNVVLLIAGLVRGQGEPSVHGAHVLIDIPQAISPDDARIVYYMVGPFGGYESFVKTEKERWSYSIDAFVNGKQANEIKIIAYLPGCQIVQLDIFVTKMKSVHALPCRKLATRTVSGQVPYALLKSDHEVVELQINYLALWGNRFFGLMDGMVPTFNVAAVVPDSSGDFVVALPDLSKQRGLGQGEFTWILRGKKTGIVKAILEPAPKEISGEDVVLGTHFPAHVTLVSPEP